MSRPDLQRRFPELDPVTLKEVLSHIAELDTVHRRWVGDFKQMCVSYDSMRRKAILLYCYRCPLWMFGCGRVSALAER